MEFLPPHHLSTYGGGAIIAPDLEWHDRLESIVHWGRECMCHYAPERCKAPEGMHHHFSYARPGFNLEMSELNACFGRFQLRGWKEQESFGGATTPFYMKPFRAFLECGSAVPRGGSISVCFPDHRRGPASGSSSAKAARSWR